MTIINFFKQRVGTDGLPRIYKHLAERLATHIIKYYESNPQRVKWLTPDGYYVPDFPEEELYDPGPGYAPGGVERVILAGGDWTLVQLTRPPPPPPVVVEDVESPKYSPGSPDYTTYHVALPLVVRGGGEHGERVNNTIQVKTWYWQFALAGLIRRSLVRASVYEPCLFWPVEELRPDWARAEMSLADLHATLLFE